MAPPPIAAPKASLSTTNTNNSIFISKFPPTASNFLCPISRYLLPYRQKQNRASNKKNSFILQDDMLANMEYVPIKFFITKYSEVSSLLSHSFRKQHHFEPFQRKQITYSSIE